MNSALPSLDELHSLYRQEWEQRMLDFVLDVPRNLHTARQMKRKRLLQQTLGSLSAPAWAGLAGGVVTAAALFWLPFTLGMALGFCTFSLILFCFAIPAPHGSAMDLASEAPRLSFLASLASQVSSPCLRKELKGLARHAKTPFVPQRVWKTLARMTVGGPYDVNFFLPLNQSEHLLQALEGGNERDPTPSSPPLEILQVDKDQTPLYNIPTDEPDSLSLYRR